MKLSELSRAVKEEGKAKNSHILIWGKPKTGKTRLAGTIAKLPWIDRVFWFDLENGYETLVYSGDLTEQEMDKIEIIQVPDTAEDHTAATTILVSFASAQPRRICTEHGKVDCKTCGPGGDSVMFSLKSCGPRDAVVIDSGSQLADSVLNLAFSSITSKNLLQYYGKFTQDMGAIMQMMQASKTNVIMVAHEQDLTTTNNEGAEVWIGSVPTLGSRNFSKKAPKYFGHVVYLSVQSQAHRAGSSSTYKDKIITGSRTGAKIESGRDFSLEALLAPQDSSPATPNVAPASTQPKPFTF